MSDENIDEPEIDWAAIRSSQVSFAELVHTYFVALCNAGFTPDQALALTLAYQASTLSR